MLVDNLKVMLAAKNEVILTLNNHLASYEEKYNHLLTNNCELYENVETYKKENFKLK